MKVIVASSERFAGSIVQALVRAGHEVVGAFSPSQGIYDRQYETWRFAVYDWIDWDIRKACLRYNVPFRISRHLSDGAVKAFLRQSQPDALVVFGWPNLIGDDILAHFPAGAMNIHPSLLPKMRGADPIFALVDSYQLHFGVSFHKLTSELDAGPIYLQKALDFSPDQTYDHLYFKAIRAIHRHLNKALEAMMTNPEGQPQSGEIIIARPFRKLMRYLDTSDGVEKVHRRALACYSHHPMLASLDEVIFSFRTCDLLRLTHSQQAPAGTIIAIGLTSMDIKLGDGQARLGGIRFVSKPTWKTPFLLQRLVRPGLFLGTANQTRRLWRQWQKKMQ